MAPFEINPPLPSVVMPSHQAQGRWSRWRVVRAPGPPFRQPRSWDRQHRRI